MHFWISLVIATKTVYYRRPQQANPFLLKGVIMQTPNNIAPFLGLAGEVSH